MTTVFHVSCTGSDFAEGSPTGPLRTINRAAQLAFPGDRVVVHEGVYREWVSPRRSGLSDQRRISYEAAPDEHVVIKGSEPVSGWELVSGSVWTVRVAAAVFGDFNPFAEEVGGDWIVHATRDTPKKHLGDVYLNGMSFYEVTERASLEEPEQRAEVMDDWTGVMDLVRNPDQTRYVWYAEVGEDATTIWANFQDADPNEELVEINVRPAVFYPRTHHVNYITVRGFELSQAASPWAPPTADQPGLIGPNWAKGWVIEDNVIHDAKCSGISIGKEISTGHNHATERLDKPGYQYQLESVFSARQIGWDREHIGSHIIRRNTIFDCGQTGIVGHLGCVFSVIEDNHIYNIALKREFYGYEIGGIKLHAAIDVIIRNNRIHDCSLGTWLDWQTQGTRVARNTYYNNNRDIFVEVSHGPYLVEHNIFASSASIENFSQGGAYVNNLVCGTVVLEPVVERPTPYHRPHSTQVAGYAAILGGDDRWIGNVFFGGDDSQAYGPERPATRSTGYGTNGYDAHPESLGDYLELVDDPSRGDHQRFAEAKQPVYIRSNAYVAGALPYRNEHGPLVMDGSAQAGIAVEGDNGYLVVHLPAEFYETTLGLITGDDLEPVRFVDAEFEERDGTRAMLDRDLLGVVKVPGEAYVLGPIAALSSEHARVQIW
ncbi:MAG: right-handed parallel beta-helix repeat-containing protein [Arachnia sp.]